MVGTVGSTATLPPRRRREPPPQQPPVVQRLLPDTVGARRVRPPPPRQGCSCRTYDRNNRQEEHPGDRLTVARWRRTQRSRPRPLTLTSQVLEDTLVQRSRPNLGLMV